MSLGEEIDLHVGVEPVGGFPIFAYAEPGVADEL